MCASDTDCGEVDAEDYKCSSAIQFMQAFSDSMQHMINESICLCGE